jgi:ABC-type multidrug transport system ATPase subunit
VIVKDLKKKLGSFDLAIDSLVIEEPGIFGLIGPNGCGKTTSAKLLMGLIAKDGGIVDFASLTERDITYLPQKPYMMTSSVEANLAYPLKIRGLKPGKEELEAMLDSIGLLKRKDQSARTLSSGEQQKLALMRALIFKPRFIIMDEALTDLDIDSLDKAETLIIETQAKENNTWLIISHQLSHIKRLCKYIFFMEKGRIEARGEAGAMLSRPDNPGLQKYLRHESLAA